MRFHWRRCNMACSCVSVSSSPKGDRTLLCEAPFGPFRQKAPVPFWRSPVVAPRIELGTTRLSAVSGRPALDYQFKSGKSGVEPPAAETANSQLGSCSRSRRAPICTSARLSFSVRTAGFEPAVSWSPTRRDPRLRHVLIEYPVGELNPNPTGIRSPSAAPLDGAQLSRTSVSVGSRGARILVSGSSDRC